MQQPAAPKPELLTEDQIAEIREIFTLFDKDCDGFVALEELGTMLRALSMNPTDSEIEKLKKDIDQAKLGKFDQNSFISTAAKRGKDAETIEDLIDALAVISSEGEKATDILIERFKFYMANKDEVIPAPEVEEVLADFDIVHENSLNIEELAKILMTK